MFIMFEYAGVLGAVPPSLWGLDVDGAWVDFSDEVSGSVGEGGGGVGGSDQVQFAIVVGVLQNGEGIFQGIEPVRYSVPNIAMQVWLSYPPVNDGSHC